MIVNPQIFNYRLIISSLIAILIALGIYSYSNYESIKAHEAFILQEKQLMQSELSQMLVNYESISDDYESVSAELAQTKKEIQIALDSLEVLEGNLQLLVQYKTQLSLLKQRSQQLLATIDALEEENQSLLAEQIATKNTLQEKENVISNLTSLKDSLKATINKAALITATNVNTQAFKYGRKNTKKITDKAKRTDAIDVCVTLAENPLVKAGPQDIYIQVLTPENNVLSDQGAVSFGENTLIYSKKEQIDYTNNTLNICSMIEASNNDKPLEKGLYFVNVFHGNRLLKSSTFELK